MSKIHAISQRKAKRSWSGNPLVGTEFSQINTLNSPHMPQLSHVLGNQGFQRLLRANRAPLYTSRSTANGMILREQEDSVSQIAINQESHSSRHLQRQVTQTLDMEYTPQSNESESDVDEAPSRDLGEWVEQFKGAVNSDDPYTPNVTETGQFYWTNLIYDALKNEIQEITSEADDPTAYSEISEESLAILQLILEHKQAQASVKTAQLVWKLQKLGKDSTARRLLRLLTAPAMTNDYSLWAFYKKKRDISDLTSYTNLTSLLAIHNQEKIACGDTAARLSDMYINNSTSKKFKRANKYRFYQNLASTAKRDFSLTANNSNLSYGDVVNYNTALGGVSQKMQDALDNGFTIYCHVLSGYKNGLGSAGFGNEKRNASSISVAGEHYILIIGHDGGNQFVFWDPDSGSSPYYGGGFGIVYYDSANNRLTTAENNASMLVDDKGDHEGAQHRYQLLSANTR